MKNVFSICFNSIHLPHREEDSLIWADISEDTSKLLSELYSSLNHRMLTSKYVDITTSQLEENVFGICIPEGYIMLKCTPNGISRSVELDGFLLRHDESLRTAWMMTRWQILFLCSDGWTKYGKVWMTPEEVISTTDKIKLNERRQTQIVEIGKRMLQASHPFNFAVTDFVKSRLPLVFHDGADVETDLMNQDEKDAIVLNASRVQEFRRNAAMNSPEKSIVLYRCSVKTFMSYKLSEANSSFQKSEMKSDFKSHLKNVDYVWCIRVFRGDKSYTMDISDYFARELEKSSIDYNNIDYLLTTVKKYADKFFQSAYSEGETEEKKQSIIDKIFNKKNH